MHHDSDRPSRTGRVFVIALDRYSIYYLADRHAIVSCLDPNPIESTAKRAASEASRRACDEN